MVEKITYHGWNNVEVWAVFGDIPSDENDVWIRSKVVPLANSVKHA